VSYIYEVDLDIGFRRSAILLRQHEEETLHEFWLTKVSNLSYNDWKNTLIKQSNAEKDYGRSNIKGADLAHL